MKNRLIRLLLVEDNPGDARLVQEMLSEYRTRAFGLEWADRLSIALDRLAVGDIDVVLLDLGLPDSTGLSTFFKTHIRAPKAAVVVLTSLDDEELAIQAVREGAQDYLIKGQVSSKQLARAILYAKQRSQAGEALQQRNRELATLNIIAESLSQSMSLNDVLETALRTTIDAVGLTAGSIHLMDKTTGKLVLAAHKGLNRQYARSIAEIPIGAGIVGRAAETASVVVSLNTSDEHETAAGDETAVHPERIRSFASAPLKSRGKVIGVIGLACHGRRDFSSGETRLLATVGEQVGFAIANAQLVEKARKLSLTDGLTGLSNRRHFHQVLDVEMSRTQRSGRSFSLAVLDLDGFRPYNDTFGHTNGDKVLTSFARALTSSLRKVDAVFRPGGDEFVVIFPATDACKARRAVDRIRPKWMQLHEVESRALETPLSFSAGIAQFPRDAQTADRLMFLAHIALYQSKQEGGQRSTLVSDLGDLPGLALAKAAVPQA